MSKMPYHFQMNNYLNNLNNLNQSSDDIQQKYHEQLRFQLMKLQNPTLAQNDLYAQQAHNFNDDDSEYSPYQVADQIEFRHQRHNESPMFSQAFHSSSFKPVAKNTPNCNMNYYKNYYDYLMDRHEKSQPDELTETNQYYSHILNYVGHDSNKIEEDECPNQPYQVGNMGRQSLDDFNAYKYKKALLYSSANADRANKLEPEPSLNTKFGFRSFGSYNPNENVPADACFKLTKPIAIVNDGMAKHQRTEIDKYSNENSLLMKKRQLIKANRDANNENDVIIVNNELGKADLN